MKSLFSKISVLFVIIFFSVFMQSSGQCLYGNCSEGLGYEFISDSCIYIGEFRGGRFNGMGLLLKNHFANYGYFQNDKLDQISFKCRTENDGVTPVKKGNAVIGLISNNIETGYFQVIKIENNETSEWFCGSGKNDKFDINNPSHVKSKERFNILSKQFFSDLSDFQRKSGELLANYERSKSSNMQTQPINCEKARREYLANNLDVKKAGLDPWSHYQNYGKKEGRKWPSCEGVASSNNSGTNYSNDNCTLPFSTQIPKLNITFVDNRKKCECCNLSLAEFKIKDKNQAILEEEVLYLMEVMENYFITNKVSSSDRDRIQKCMNDYLVKKYGAFTAMSGTVGNFERFLGAGLFTARMSVDRKIPLYQVSDFCSKRCENDPRCKD